MIQEYLFSSDKYKADLEELIVPEKVTKEIITIENSGCWILLMSVDGKSRDAAKILDPLNRQVCEKYRPTVLTNECSAYFNKALYPTVNELERKLRKLLYLASSIQGDENSQKVIVRLEEQDLGTIFEILFSDAEFVKKAKETVTRTLSWQFTRAELLDAISKLNENRLWTILLGDDCVKTLCSSFTELRNYRNDIMHAHNIDFDRFNKAEKLFKEVNAELDSAIGKLIGAKEENADVTPANFNSTLSSALEAMQSRPDISSLFAASQALTDIASRPPYIGSELSRALSQIGQYTRDGYTLYSQVSDVVPTLAKIAALQSDATSMTGAVNEFVERLASNKNDIAPILAELMQSMSEKNLGTLPDSNNAKQDDEEKKSNGQDEI